MGIRRPSTHTIVLTGISRRLGRMVARALHSDRQLIGLDPRGCRHVPASVSVHQYDLRSRQAEDLFRRNRVDALIHLEAEANWSGSATESRRRSVLGTQRLLEFCHRHGVPKVIVLSSANTYGPSPDNNQFLSEESPLMAGHRFPTMRNLVEVDMYAQSFFWRHPEVDTVILRPCNVVGRISNHISRYLELHNTPTLAGFDPMMQVLSPEDLIAAIQLALKPGVRGIFNLSGPGPVPLSELIRRLGHRNLPVPEPLLRLSISMVSGVGLSNVPSAEVDYLKYVCMVDDRRARTELRYAPAMTLDQTLSALMH